MVSQTLARQSLSTFKVHTSHRRNGNLRIPLPFDEALKAAVEAKPPEKKPRKPRQKKRAKT
jgi:hypothetical protein